MNTKTKYKVVFYVDDIIAVENLINGVVNPRYYNFQVLEKTDKKHSHYAEKENR